MKKKKLTANLPDGTIATRTTARDYQYVVAKRIHRKWRADNWTSRRDLAERIYEKAVPHIGRDGFDVKIIEVNQ
jgi:hypothetical protein